MSESFGARMRRRREEQQIALGTIAEQTKIKVSMLEALERDDVSHWPTGIFRRAFVRAYACAIHLDPDAVVHEFYEVFPDPEEVASAAAIAAATDAAGGAAPPNRLRWLFDSAVGSLSHRWRQPDDASGNRPIAPIDRLHHAMPAEGFTSDRHPRESDRVERALDMISASARSGFPQNWSPDFVELADLCTELARVENPGAVRRLLQRAAGILDAIGVVVWIWDPALAALKPAVASGYPDAALAYWPNVQRDADNITARAFRSGQTCSVNGEEQESSALVVPLVVPGGCSGVLAIELGDASRTAAVRPAATILAAQFSQLVTGAAADGQSSMEPVGVAAGLQAGRATG